MKAILAGAATAALLLSVTTTPAAAATGLKTVYGWAKISGNAHFILTPYKATLGEIGESGLLGWSLDKKTGSPVRIAYTEGLDFRQVSKKCGKRAAGYPHENYDKKTAFGKTKCDPIHLYALLKQGRVAVRVVYDNTKRPMSVKVWELKLP
ncbi:hypothetical protein [Nonomuraea typhae]|uniref:hypothetical protein n=1 Tax=Nonomuraea typhae TaxID=2603600 RepID=UPI0012F9758B|nr:hypothetical protein [Nonomuraea typhae]